MALPKLFGVNLPQTNRLKLRNQLRNLQPDQKATLYFFYSEFLLRANRNLAYKEVLNRGIFTALDGRGLHWSMWRIWRRGWLPTIYTKWIADWPLFLRPFLFFPFFALEYVWNVCLSSFCLITKRKFSQVTQNELILGRDFSYDLLTLAEENNWKTLIIGGSTDNSQTIVNLIGGLYPQLDFDIWSQPYDSDLMRDQPRTGLDVSQLSTGNLLTYFPQLGAAKTHIELFQPDLLLVCLGGASGKQEFFIDNLYKDEDVNFTLAAGVGAALDHLGGGAKQVKAPSWLTSLGLEWLYRLIKLPYRRGRILDSVFTLWWWTTVQEFMLTGRTSRQFVNLVFSQDGKLLAKQTSEGLEFLMIPVSRKDSLKKNFLKTSRLTGLQFQLIDFDTKPTKLPLEKLPVKLATFGRYLWKYEDREPFLSLVHYSHSAYQNALPAGLVWVDPRELESKLNPLHRRYWQAYLTLHSG